MNGDSSVGARAADPLAHLASSRWFLLRVYGRARLSFVEAGTARPQPRSWVLLRVSLVSMSFPFWLAILLLGTLPNTNERERLLRVLLTVLAVVVVSAFPFSFFSQTLLRTPVVNFELPSYFTTRGSLIADGPIGGKAKHELEEEAAAQLEVHDVREEGTDEPEEEAADAGRQPAGGTPGLPAAEAASGEAADADRQSAAGPPDLSDEPGALPSEDAPAGTAQQHSTEAPPTFSWARPRSYLTWRPALISFDDRTLCYSSRLVFKWVLLAISISSAVLQARAPGGTRDYTLRLLTHATIVITLALGIDQVLAFIWGVRGSPVYRAARCMTRLCRWRRARSGPFSPVDPRAFAFQNLAFCTMLQPVGAVLLVHMYVYETDKGSSIYWMLPLAGSLMTSVMVVAGAMCLWCPVTFLCGCLVQGGCLAPPLPETPDGLALLLNYGVDGPVVPLVGEALAPVRKQPCHRRDVSSLPGRPHALRMDSVVPAQLSEDSPVAPPCWR